MTQNITMPAWLNTPTARGNQPTDLTLFQRGLSSILLLAVLVGCGVAPDKHTIRMGLASAPLNLDPRFATDATSVRINRLLYQRLVEFDAQSLPVPGIAHWQQISPTHYRFHLREPTPRFSNEEPVTAKDVLATYNYVLDANNASPHRSALELIETMEMVDRMTVDFRLNRTDPMFPAYLVLDILPARLIREDHPFESSPVGSGGFDFIGRPEPGRLLLERRRDGQSFELIEVKNPTVRVLKLLRGEIQLLQNDLSPELIGYLKSRSEIDINQIGGSNLSYIGFNMQDGDIKSPLVRNAIAQAIDREAIIRQVMHRSARRAESLFPPEHWVGSVELEPLNYSPEQAKALLREAGYSSEAPLRLVYKTSSDPYRIRLATILQSQLNAVGIEVELRSYDWGTFFGDIKAGRFQLYSLTWVGLRTPDSFRYIFATDSAPPHGANRGRYSNSLVDALLHRAEDQPTLAQAASDYRRIQQILHTELPYIPLWYEDQFSASRKEIEGYQLLSNGDYDGLNQVGFVLVNEEKHAAN